MDECRQHAFVLGRRLLRRQLLFEQKPLRLFLINGGYHSLQYTLIGLILGLWHQCSDAAAGGDSGRIVITLASLLATA